MSPYKSGYAPEYSEGWNNGDNPWTRGEMVTAGGTNPYRRDGLDQLFSGMQPPRTSPTGDGYTGTPEVSYGQDTPQSRGIWTGTGYDYSMPGMVKASDIHKSYRGGSNLYGSYEEAMANRYGGGDAGSQMFDTPTVEYGLGGDYGNFTSGLNNNYSAQFNPDGTLSGMRIKSGEREGTIVPYVKDANGNYVPNWEGLNTQEWDTNRHNRNRNMALGTIAGMAIGGPMIAEALGVAGTGTAAGTATGVGSAVNPYALTAADFAATSAPASAWGTTGAGFVPGTSAAAGFTPGAGIVAGEGGMATLGSAGSAAAAGGASSSIVDMIQSAVNQGMPIQEAMKFAEQMGGGQQGQGGQGGLESILGILAGAGKGYYDSKQMKDYSKNLKGIYSDLNARQDQFRIQLLNSYQDPNQFYNSNQWKGLESVYQNSIDRDAAKSGRLSNPTDREVLLQSHAMKELEKYRDGLRSSAGLTKPEAALGPLAEGYKAEAYANTPVGAALDQIFGSRSATGGTRGGNVTDIVKTISGFGGDIKQIYDFVSGWFK